MSGKYLKLILVGLTVFFTSNGAFAVTTRIISQSSAGEFAGGKTQNVVIGSQGQLSLGPAYQSLAEKLPQAWSVNAVLAAHGAVYAGTSPNGCIYKYAGDSLIKIYPPEPIKVADANAAKDANSVKDANAAVKTSETSQSGYLTNEHVFAFGTDSVGRLLAGISGSKCRLIRFEGDNAETIFEPNDSTYIFAIATDDFGNIYIATGPNGKVFRLDPFGQKPELIYRATDKNILSLTVGVDGFVYAGSDGRGIIYRIDPVTKTSSALYDSGQTEITALAFDSKGILYAAATTPGLSKAQSGEPLQNLPGRPETGQAAPSPNKPSLQAEAAPAPRKTGEEDQPRAKAVFPMTSFASMPSHIYKITPDGFVTDIFQDNSVFLSLIVDNQRLVIGTGNKGQLYSVDMQSEEKEIVYKDEQANQISSLYNADANTIYLGTANPPKIIKLSKSQAQSGTYSSDLIDADQPAKWGKLQLEASIPAGTSVQVSARSSNVGDINDPAFSPWSNPVDYNDQPVQLNVPAGRFVQYKLTLKGNGSQSPQIRKVTVPFVVPNLAPQVQSILMARAEDKPGMFNIGYRAIDRNGDKLIYRLDIRKIGRQNWIKIKDELETEIFAWDSRTVEDGRYEIKVTASDARSNNTDSALSDSRISEPFVVDNTPPKVVASNTDVKDKQVLFTAAVEDNLSTIASVAYTVDSGTNWITTLPVDSVFDTTREELKISLTDLAPGQHVLAVRMTDSVGNTSYATFDFEIK